MRSLVLVALLIALSLALGPPRAAASCGYESCSAPACWAPTVHERPGTTRSYTISCSGTTGASVATQPAHGQVSNVATGDYSVTFDLHADEDAPRNDEAVFEVQGRAESIQLHVPIEVVPLAENSPPVCDGAEVSQRSDGTGPVDVFMHPWCRDPD